MNIIHGKLKSATMEKVLMLWNTNTFFDAETRAELAAITDTKEIEDRFYRDLAFGTGGMRGVMGAGTNRMNVYIIRKATTGLAKYFLEQNGEVTRTRGVAIAYDTRNHSQKYALAAALTLCAQGIPAFLFCQPMPTPVLSFAVRHLSCAAGIVITASHNPKEYNGYKVYDANGCQILPHIARELTRFVEDTDIINTVIADEQEARNCGLLKYIPPELLDSYLNAVLEQAHPLDADLKRDLHVVYTPLHGAGSIPVQHILKRCGIPFSLVDTQVVPDGNFPTVDTPNPENPEALAQGMKQAEIEVADLVLGTDPDCDRVGVAARCNGVLKLLTGNQIGALLVNYILTRRKEQLTKRDTIVKTIVTSELGTLIANKHGLHTVDTLTGFKYIGDQACQYEGTEKYCFLMGYEESYGYLIGTHARDKDAVVTSMLICEMAAYYKARGLTLFDVLHAIYQEHGFFLDALDSFTMKGKTGLVRIQYLMEQFRTLGFVLPGDMCTEVKDYIKGIDGLPVEDVIKFYYASGSWIAVRPSGTEPKLKVYYSIRNADEAEAQVALNNARKVVREVIEG